MIKHREEDDNRIKLLAVPEEHILNCFILNATSPGDIWNKLSLQVPNGTIILGSHYDILWNVHTLVLYNSVWPVVIRGDTPERLTLDTTVVQVKADIPRKPLGTQPLTQEPGVTVLGMSKHILANGVIANGLHLGSSRASLVEKEFYNPILGEPYKDPFDKDWSEKPEGTWRDRGSQL